MRMLLLAAGMFGALVATARAGDDGSPIAGKLPDNDKSQVSYLFMLKKNGIALRMEPDQFCQDLGYGHAVTRSDGQDSSGRKKGFWQPTHFELDEDGKKRLPELEWVICQAPAPKK